MGAWVLLWWWWSRGEEEEEGGGEGEPNVLFIKDERGESFFTVSDVFSC